MTKLRKWYTTPAYSYFKIMLGTVLGYTGKIFPDLAGHPVLHRHLIQRNSWQIKKTVKFEEIQST